MNYMVTTNQKPVTDIQNLERKKQNITQNIRKPPGKRLKQEQRRTTKQPENR